jgi:methanogen homocitrate synthase
MASESTSPWLGDQWWVSPLNFQGAIRRQFALPSQVTFHDVTLRDGEQTPGVVFRKNEKVAIARALDEAGVQRIEAGMPVVSPEDAAAVKEIAHLGLQAKVVGFGRVLPEDVDAVRAADCRTVICECPVGVPKLRQFGWAPDVVITKAVEAVSYAKRHGLETIFFGVDTTRAELAFLDRLYGAIVNQAKADALVLVDTVACTTPEAMAFLVRHVRECVRVPLEVHCHTDFGLGTACTIAGVLAGAQVVHTSVNGIGERTGNTAMEEVAVALKLLYGARVDLRFEKFQELSRLVQQYSCVPLAPNKPVVGPRAFTREAGIGVAGWIKYQLGSEAYLPEFVGNAHGVVLGKKSGRHSIEWKLDQLGLHATPEQVGEILERVKRHAEETKTEVSDAELRRIVAEVAPTLRA